MSSVTPREGRDAVVLAFPPSNRGESALQKCIEGPRAEVDTIGLSVPIRDVDHQGATVTWINAGTPEERAEGRRALPGGGFIAWGRGESAWIEASLPKRAGEDNIEAVGLCDALELIEGLHSEACEYLEVNRERGGHSWQDSRVVRLDLPRDFDGIASAPIMLDGLATVPLRGRVKRRRYADVEHNRAETLAVGNNEWRATLYDKHAETAGKAPEGRLRFEARMRSDVLTGQWAKRNGGAIRAVRDMEESKMRGLRRAMFERVGYDREVAASGRVAEAIERSDLTERERRDLWAYLTMPAAGADPGFSRNVERKYRRLAERIGLTVLPRGTEIEGVSMCLDYESGREVLRAA